MTTRTLKRLERAAMRLYNGRRSGLKYPPHGFDCEGGYWYIRDKRAAREFRSACAAHAQRKGAKRKGRGK